MHVSPRQWRKDSKITMAGAARLVGVRGKNPARTWHRWESGHLDPPLQVVSKIEELSGGAVSLSSWARVKRSDARKRAAVERAEIAS